MKKVILSIALFAAGLFVTSTTIQAAERMNSNIVAMSVQQDDGFVDVKLEELPEPVQAAINALAEKYEVKGLKFDAQRQITKVEATNKTDQAYEVLYFDAEGKQVTLEEAPEQEVQEEVQQPSAEMSYVRQDDGFADITFESLTEKVQAAVRAVAETHELNVLQYNAEKKLTKLVATNKEDQSSKTFYFNNEGEETTLDSTPAETQTQEEVGDTTRLF
ncbi:hypothetical protein [Limibacterium fermenti]|uniref:hypothetical protein n=1 Tax=Limibacterium fermenti TaxID=3229863 RepID=UPI003A641AFC